MANQAQVFAPPAGVASDADSLIATIKAFAGDNAVPAGELIIPYGYDDTVMPGGRLLNRDYLDAAFPDNPVWVDHVSMLGGVLNSLAQEKYGFSVDFEPPPGGVVVRQDGTGLPYGLILETAFLPVMEQSEPMTPEQEIAAAIAGQMLYAEAGITTAYEGATHLASIQTMKRATDTGANIIDVIADPFITDLQMILDEFPLENWGKYDNHFKIGGVKITIDGSSQGRTARFTTPYLSGGPAGEDPWLGDLTLPQETVNEMVKTVYNMGVALNLHANGDGAINESSRRTGMRRLTIWRRIAT